MKNKIVTVFNKNDLDWGLSFLISLKHKASFNEEVIVITDGLDDRSLEVVKKLCTQIKTLNKIDDDSVIDFISSIEDSKIALWSSKLYFQSSIESMFNEIDDKILIADNKDNGFVAANSNNWKYIHNIKKIIRYFSNDSVFDCLNNFFCSRIEYVNSTWNNTSIIDLKFNGNSLIGKEFIPKTIHPKGISKDVLKDRNILFWENHKELFNSYKEIKINKIFLKR